MVDVDSCFGALGFSIKVLMGFRIELLGNLSEVSACACVLGIEPSELYIVSQALCTEPCVHEASS